MNSLFKPSVLWLECFSHNTIGCFGGNGWSMLKLGIANSVEEAISLVITHGHMFPDCCLCFA